jgi:hypothetical protein
MKALHIRPLRTHTAVQPRLRNPTTTTVSRSLNRLSVPTKISQQTRVPPLHHIQPIRNAKLGFHFTPRTTTHQIRTLHTHKYSKGNHSITYPSLSVS